MECFGQHAGGKQQANLGDGHGWVDQRVRCSHSFISFAQHWPPLQEVLREHFGLPVLGTCLESLIGGNHLRTWRQDGPDKNSGALFLAWVETSFKVGHDWPLGLQRISWERSIGKTRYYPWWLQHWPVSSFRLWSVWSRSADGIPGTNLLKEPRAKRIFSWRPIQRLSLTSLACSILDLKALTTVWILVWLSAGSMV